MVVVLTKQNEDLSSNRVVSACDPSRRGQAWTHRHDDKVDARRDTLVHVGSLLVGQADQGFGKDDIVFTDRRCDGASKLVVLRLFLVVKEGRRRRLVCGGGSHR